MRTKITLPFLMFFLSTLSTAQSRKQMNGRIIVPDASSADVLILNLNTEQEVKSNADGSFTLLAQPQDVIDFASSNLEYVRKIVSNSDFIQSEFKVYMKAKRIVLDEVEIVNKKSYSAVDMGILTKPAKSYTPAERRLKTAGDFKPIHLLGLLGGTLPVDPIINAINGKTKRLKKELVLERNQKRLLRFQSLFPEEELVANLKIVGDDLMEFTYYVLDEDDFKKMMDAGDRNKMLFYLIQKYSEFKNQKSINEKQ